MPSADTAPLQAKFASMRALTAGEVLFDCFVLEGALTSEPAVALPLIGDSISVSGCNPRFASEPPGKHRGVLDAATARGIVLIREALAGGPFSISLQLGLDREQAVHLLATRQLEPDLVNLNLNLP